MWGSCSTVSSSFSVSYVGILFYIVQFILSKLCGDLLLQWAVHTHHVSLSMIYKGAEITSNKSTQTLHKAVQYFLFWCIITGVFLVEKAWARTLLLVSSALSCIGNVYLAVILFFVLKDVCIVCMSIYAVNFSLMFLNYKLYFMDWLTETLVMNVGCWQLIRLSDNHFSLNNQISWNQSRRLI